MEKNHKKNITTVAMTSLSICTVKIQQTPIPETLNHGEKPLE
jgi:hypothetical protein